jgi:hypothetical protein
MAFRDDFKTKILRYTFIESVTSIGLYRNYVFSLYTKSGDDYNEIDTAWRRGIIFSYNYDGGFIYNTNEILIDNNSSYEIRNFSYGIFDWSGSDYETINLCIVVDTNKIIPPNGSLLILPMGIKIRL